MDRFKLLVEMIADGEEVIFTTREEVFKVCLQPVPQGTSAFTKAATLNINVEQVKAPGAVIS